MLVTHHVSRGLGPIPPNMAEPIRGVRGEITDTNLGFAPHGAGRNVSRSAHKRQMAEFGLGTVVDRITPYGCIMAGDWNKHAP